MGKRLLFSFLPTFFSALSWEGGLEVGAMSVVLPIDWL